MLGASHELVLRQDEFLYGTSPFWCRFHLFVNRPVLTTYVADGGGYETYG